MGTTRRVSVKENTENDVEPGGLSSDGIVDVLVGSHPSYWNGWNRAMRGAYIKGARAAHSGKSETECPYSDRRNDRGCLTWSRAFIRSWEDGHRDAVKHMMRKSLDFTESF